MNSRKQKRVLICDDDEIVRLVIAKIAEKYGAEVTFAPDGCAAIEILKLQKDFDVIFLDLIMPHASGWDLLDVLKDDLQLQQIPVILISGAPLSATEKSRLTSRVSVFLDKLTFSLASFEDVVGRYLGEQGNLVP